MEPCKENKFQLEFTAMSVASCIISLADVCLLGGSFYIPCPSTLFLLPRKFTKNPDFIDKLETFIAKNFA